MCVLLLLVQQKASRNDDFSHNRAEYLAIFDITSSKSRVQKTRVFKKPTQWVFGFYCFFWTSRKK